MATPSRLLLQVAPQFLTPPHSQDPAWQVASALQITMERMKY